MSCDMQVIVLRLVFFNVLMLYIVLIVSSRIYDDAFCHIKLLLSFTKVFSIVTSILSGSSQLLLRIE